MDFCGATSSFFFIFVTALALLFNNRHALMGTTGQLGHGRELFLCNRLGRFLPDYIELGLDNPLEQLVSEIEHVPVQPLFSPHGQGNFVFFKVDS